MAGGPGSVFVQRGALISTGGDLPAPVVIAFQYNPASLRRTLSPQMAGGEENERSEAVRFTGAPVQTIAAEIELDATDALNVGDRTAETAGVLPQLSQLELLAYPVLSAVQRNQQALSQGAMEVAPLTAPRCLFVWGSKRVLPVRLTSFEITEEMFDRWLRPIRVTVVLNMRVLNYSDLDASNSEYHDFTVYQQNLAAFAAQAAKVATPQKTIGVNPADD